MLDNLTPQQSNLIEELKEALSLVLCPQEKADFSEHTYKSYFKHAAAFVLWCEKNHGVQSVSDCRAYVDAWIQYNIDRGLSAHTIKLQAAALAKLYGCKMTDFGVKTPGRSRLAITRSRGEKIRDKSFSEKDNQEFIQFCRCTGLHRAELEHIRGEDLRELDGKYYFEVSKAAIGGRPRMAPIIGTPGEISSIVVQARIAGSEKIFSKVSLNADVQGYRIEYAKRIYDLYKRDISEFKNERLIMHNNRIVDAYVSPNRHGDPTKRPDIYSSDFKLKPGWRDVSSAYYCRNDFVTVVFDRAALRKVADALGIAKEADVVSSYFGIMDFTDESFIKEALMGKKESRIIENYFEEDIVPTDFTEEMSSSYLDYAVSVISSRAIPDVRDGLKPVHRRILWAMKSLGLSSSGDYKKSARVVGETMGKYHPHGDASIYDAMVHMAQDWCYNHPLVDGHGNYGSVEGDDAAASRYTETRLAAITEDILLSDLDKDVVDFVPNFDNKEREPTVLPACIPNILISGTDGIAVGMASKMPTHNLGEVIDATVALLDNPKLTDEDLLGYMKGPDFATGGIVVNKSELPEIYKTGAGRIRVRGRVKKEEGERGKINVVVTEIPCTMIGSIDKFMDAVADLSRTKVLPDVVDIKNFSGKEGIRIVIELRKGADADYTINTLYKKAKLEDTFGYNAMLLSSGVPRQMPLTQIIAEFLAFYRETSVRKYTNLLEREKRNEEIKEGLIKAVDCIDAIIEMLRGSSVVSAAKDCLTKGTTEGIKFRTQACEKIAKKFCFTEAQANAILDMKLQKLIGLEMTTLEKELEKTKKNISLYSGILSSKTKMNNKMKADMLDIKAKYAKKRKTDIIDADAIVIKKPEVKAEKMYAVVNRFGYIKLLDDATYERNKENVFSDYRYVCEVMNTGKLYLFAEEGKCHQIKALSVPTGKYNDKGVPLETVSGLTDTETVICLVSDLLPKEELVFVTEQGFVKKVPLTEFVSSRKTIDATKIGENDKLVAIAQTAGKKTLEVITEKGKRISLDIPRIKMLKRNSVGVQPTKLKTVDKIIAVAVGE